VKPEDRVLQFCRILGCPSNKGVAVFIREQMFVSKKHFPMELIDLNEEKSPRLPGKTRVAKF
jgi:hypothetical protein